MRSTVRQAKLAPTLAALNRRPIATSLTTVQGQRRAVDPVANSWTAVRRSGTGLRRCSFSRGSPILGLSDRWHHHVIPLLPLEESERRIHVCHPWRFEVVPPLVALYPLDQPLNDHGMTVSWGCA